MKKSPAKKQASHRLLFEVAIGFAVVAIAFGLGAQTLPRLVLTSVDQFAAVLSSVLVDLTNLDRSTNAVVRLKINPLLEEAARLKASDMATKGYFAHVSPEGVTPWHWFAVAGYDYADAGENLAIDFFESADVEKAWMNSPLHRANILNGSFTEVGIATATGTYQGYPTTFVVQMFGRPIRASKALLTETVTASSPTFTAVTRQAP